MELPPADPISIVLLGQQKAKAKTHWAKIYSLNVLSWICIKMSLLLLWLLVWSDGRCQCDPDGLFKILQKVKLGHLILKSNK